MQPHRALSGADRLHLHWAGAAARQAQASELAAASTNLHGELIVSKRAAIRWPQRCIGTAAHLVIHSTWLAADARCATGAGAMGRTMHGFCASMVAILIDLVAAK